jgi:hypothetical protein
VTERGPRVLIAAINANQLRLGDTSYSYLERSEWPIPRRKPSRLTNQPSLPFGTRSGDVNLMNQISHARFGHSVKVH